jgi:hypothetical protein
MRRIERIAFGLTLLAMVAGTTYPTARSSRTSEEFRQSYELTPNGTVSLHNINGNLKVETWNKNEVSIEALKTADDKSDLDELKIEVEASNDKVAIDTKYPEDDNGRRGHNCGVDYTLTIPEGATISDINVVNGEVEISGVKGKVTASTVNGAIHAGGLARGCDFETVNGSIEAAMDALSAGEDSRLKSVNGRIVLYLPENPDVDIEARTTMGRIADDFGLESSRDTEEHPYVKVGDSLRGKIGKGGASVRIETVNGAIRILKSKNAR